jgi:hypothetical protein
MERFRSAHQTQNEMAQFLDIGMEALHPNWLLNQTHPGSTRPFVCIQPGSNICAANENNPSLHTTDQAKLEQTINQEFHVPNP